MTKRSKVVFLSYAHADEEVVIRIRQHLLDAGFAPWMDKFDLPPGKTWRDEIGKAIRKSGAFLSLVSNSSVDRGGILAGEMKLALDLRAERLDDGGIFIPVRVELCKLPAELHDIQALDWYSPGGPDNLTAALASLLKPPSLMERIREFVMSPGGLAVIAVICFAAGLAVYQAMSRISRLETYEAFLRSRPGSPVAPLADATPQIGVTVWRVTEDNSAGSGPCSFLRFSRQPFMQPVHTGDKLRMDVQASRPGYIYVISRELDDAGKQGPPRLLYPVLTANGVSNRIMPGSALLIPPASDVCNTLQLTHAGAAEQVSVLFSDEPIAELPARDGPYLLDEATVTKLETSGTQSTLVQTPKPATSRNVELPDGESRDLDYASSGPDVVFTASARTAGPVIATFALKTQE